jgi:hypothetical protein
MNETEKDHSRKGAQSEASHGRIRKGGPNTWNGGPWEAENLCVEKVKQEEKVWAADRVAVPGRKICHHCNKFRPWNRREI